MGVFFIKDNIILIINDKNGVYGKNLTKIRLPNRESGILFKILG